MQRQGLEGSQIVKFAEEKIEWMGELYEELLFEPKDKQQASFELLNVTMGLIFIGKERRIRHSGVL